MRIVDAVALFSFIIDGGSFFFYIFAPELYNIIINMKNKIRLLMTLLLLAVMGNVWAEEIVFNFQQNTESYDWDGTPASSSDLSVGDTFTNGDVSFVYTAKGGGTNLRWWSTKDGLRSYNGNQFKIEVSSGEIESITFTGTCELEEVSSTGGNYDDSNSTWTAPEGSGVTSVEFVCVQGSGNRTINKITVVVSGATATPSISAENVSVDYDATSGEISYSVNNPVDGASVSASSSDNWISNVTVNSSESKVTFGVTTNEASTSRTGTITLSYANDTETLVTKDVTVTQGCPPSPDYVTLPFEWTGGSSSDLTDINGVTASGLGNDYASGNAPYLIKLDYTGDYIQFKTNEKPGIVTIGVKMIGGGSTSTITVQGSSDGVTFTNIEVLEISGAQNSVHELSTNSFFGDADRYVRLLFTKGSNVGVGPITISKVADPTEAEVSFEQENATVKVGKTFTNPITKPATLNVTYSVTEGMDYASVDGTTGKVTGLAAGQATITASWETGASYLAGSASYTIEVIESVEEVYAKITNEDELYDGLEILIVNEDNSKAMGDQKTNNFGSVEVVLSYETATVPADNATTLILKGGPGAWSFMTPDGKYLCAASSNSNYLHTTETPNDNDNAKATITFDEDDNAVIVFQGDCTRNVLRFNSNNPQLFSCYSTGQRPVQIYANKTLEKVILNTDGYKSYVTRNAIDWGRTTSLQKNVHGYMVTEFTKSSVTMVELGASYVTSAETPLIIQGKAGKNSLVISNETGADYSDSNLLKRGYERNENESDYMYVLQKTPQWKAETTYYQYKFYRLNPTRWDQIGDRQAYLVLPESERDGQASTATMVIIHATDEEPLSEDAGVLDGINSIERNDVLNGEFYTISGQRVTAPKKGLYIVNGKKVLVK